MISKFSLLSFVVCKLMHESEILLDVHLKYRLFTLIIKKCNHHTKYNHFMALNFLSMKSNIPFVALFNFNGLLFSIKKKKRKKL